VLSAADPVRVFESFATLDLLSQGRAEMVVGRGSFTEAFPLFGLQLKDYDSLFAEKLDLLLKLRENEVVHWSGKHRAPLTAPAAKSAAHLAGCGRDAGIVRPRRDAGIAADGRHHRRRDAAIPPAR
jgi:alkanesulfonate monooxygenase SsuD/methylene tetrahydromethanopterin reductase-like flavin-dependent oxidoreductase (luciferase family)